MEIILKLSLMNFTAITLLTSASAAFALADFAHFDQNRDNIITGDEYLNVIMAPFDRVDTDSSNWLSQDELMVIARQRAEGTQRKPRRMVNRVFERYDSNEDRRLTALELGFGGSGEFFNLYDRNQNGVITLAEWQSRSETQSRPAIDTQNTENEPADRADPAPQDTTSTTRPVLPRVPTEPTEPVNDNAWKLDQTPDITSVQPMTGSWLFDLRP